MAACVFFSEHPARPCKGCGDMEGWRKGGEYGPWKRRSLVSPQKGSDVIEQEPFGSGVKGSKKMSLILSPVLILKKNPAISAFPSLWKLSTLSAQEIFSRCRILHTFLLTHPKLGVCFLLFQEPDSVFPLICNLIKSPWPVSITSSFSLCLHDCLCGCQYWCRATHMCVCLWH